MKEILIHLLIIIVSCCIESVWLVLKGVGHFVGNISLKAAFEGSHKILVWVFVAFEECLSMNVRDINWCVWVMQQLCEVKRVIRLRKRGQLVYKNGWFNSFLKWYVNQAMKDHGYRGLHSRKPAISKSVGQTFTSLKLKPHQLPHFPRIIVFVMAFINDPLQFL